MGNIKTVSELRPGNLLLRDGEEIVVRGVDRADEWIYEERFETPFTKDKCTGIEITEQILERFAFNKKNSVEQGGDYYEKDGLCIQRDGSKWDLWIEDEEDDSKYFTLGIRTHYIHKLQNLYFELNGCEL